MKRKKAKKSYIAYGLALLAYIIAAGSVVVGMAGRQVQQAGLPDMVHVGLVAGFGAIIGVLRIFEESGHIGYWAFCWTKFVSMIFAAAVVIASQFVLEALPQSIVSHVAWIADVLKSDIAVTFAAFIAGWALPSSIYKEKVH